MLKNKTNFVIREFKHEPLIKNQKMVVRKLGYKSADAFASAIASSLISSNSGILI